MISIPMESSYDGTKRTVGRPRDGKSRFSRLDIDVTELKVLA